MINVANFIKDVDDRIRSPFISSFVISWVVVNWQVPISLILYNKRALLELGYESHFEFIRSVINWKLGFVVPTILAILYTLGYPFLRNALMAFQVWIRTWGTNWMLEISKSGKVSMDKFLLLREKYLNQSKELEKVFIEEGKYLGLNQELSVEREKLSTQLNEVKNNLQYWQNMNLASILDGEWEYTHKEGNNAVFTYRLTIFSGRINLYSDLSKMEKIETFDIRDFFCDPFSRKLCLSLSGHSNPKSIIFHSLTFPNGIQELTGTENFKSVITYKKLK